MYHLNAKVTAIAPDGVTYVDQEGQARTIPAASVVLAAGMRARSDEVEALRPLCATFYVVGDARQAKNVMMAVRDGYDAVVDLAVNPHHHRHKVQRKERWYQICKKKQFLWMQDVRLIWVQLEKELAVMW